MPPFIPRKRNRPTSPTPEKSTPKKKRQTLFDAVDEPTPSSAIDANKKFIESLDKSSPESFSDTSSADFEDVLPKKKQKVAHSDDEDSEDDEDEDEIDWENALGAGTDTPTTAGPAATGDLELTLSKEQNFGSLTEQHGDKKGPSKLERQIRIATHQIHVQFLLFHFAVRNGWACDQEVQTILVEQLPPVIAEQVKVYRKASAIPDERPKEPSEPPKKRGRGRPTKTAPAQRDWGSQAARQEEGVPDMSRGDPLLKLLKDLVIYWKRRFRVTAPSLRKQGYKAMHVLQEEITSFRKDSHDQEKHGEKIVGKEGFRRCARKLEGSRDVGALLFAALLRGLGIESRLVASLQPIGFAWAKAEDAVVKKKRASKISAISSSEEDSDSESEQIAQKPNSSKAKANKGATAKGTATKGAATTGTATNVKGKNKASSQRQTRQGAEEAPISLDGSSELSEAQSLSSDSVQEIKTPSMAKRKPNAAYDRDLAFPNCWVEAISPVTSKVIPVDPMVSHTVVSNDEHLAAFEPRGKKADKAKQVLAYVVAYSADGSAKDVTTRYLKRRTWPGRTKGVRLPVEKVAIRDRRGKVKGHMQVDWFKRALSGYTKSDTQRSAADDIEDATDLQAAQPHKKKDGTDAEIDTLQGYKQSATYVLERFLRREEALQHGAAPVRTFTTGKGASAKDEPVYLRRDVVACKTAESWHKEGRQVRAGAQPLKSVAVRAVTLARRQEVEAAARETGERPTQGLYAAGQTEPIIPPPIENGVIPKNAFGNIDCFVPTMVPAGAVHLPIRGAARACRRLGCDFAEAVVGFEFGNRRAVPVLQGVVVAEENAGPVVDEVARAEAEKQAKDDAKREKAALTTWKKFLTGLRIVERVQDQYGADAGHGKDETNIFVNPNKAGKKAAGAKAKTKAKTKVDAAAAPIEDGPSGEVDLGGVDDGEQGGGFVVEDGEDGEMGGGFVIEED